MADTTQREQALKLEAKDILSREAVRAYIWNTAAGMLDNGLADALDRSDLAQRSCIAEKDEEIARLREAIEAVRIEIDVDLSEPPLSWWTFSTRIKRALLALSASSSEEALYEIRKLRASSSKPAEPTYYDGKLARELLDAGVPESDPRCKAITRPPRTDPPRRCRITDTICERTEWEIVTHCSCGNCLEYVALFKAAHSRELQINTPLGQQGWTAAPVEPAQAEPAATVKCATCGDHKVLRTNNRFNGDGVLVDWDEVPCPACVPAEVKPE